MWLFLWNDYVTYGQTRVSWVGVIYVGVTHINIICGSHTNECHMWVSRKWKWVSYMVVAQMSTWVMDTLLCSEWEWYICGSHTNEYHIHMWHFQGPIHRGAHSFVTLLGAYTHRDLYTNEHHILQSRNWISYVGATQMNVICGSHPNERGCHMWESHK